MAVDNVPWMVGGGVLHSTNIARVLAYAAFNGAEGIIGPGDLEVRELDIPGGAVQVMPGACSILKATTGSVPQYEAYACRVPAAEQVPIAQNGSAGDRYEMLIARVLNPFETSEDNEPAPGTEQDYSYFRLEVIPCGATDTTPTQAGKGSWSAIPLARIRVPASTATILQGHVTDLRTLPAKRQADTFNVVAPTVERKLLSSEYVDWPSEANLSVEVPEWATHVQARAILGGIRYGATGSNGGAGWNVVGNLRIRIGGGLDAIHTQNTGYNVSLEDGVDRTTLMCGSPAMAVPKTMRGESRTIQIEGQRSAGTTELVSDVSSMVSIEVKFTQGPESSVA